MKIVIEINDEDYNEVRHCLYGKGYNFFEQANLIKNVIWSVFYGIPLPKGHGRLIDADALDKDCESSEYHEAITSWLDLAPTIIEADKGE